MAEFALGLTKTAVEGTVSRVKSAIDEEEKLKVRVRNDLLFITGEFEMMQSFLDVANKERAKNEVVRTWVRQIRNLAFDVEDCVELVISLDIKSGWSWLWRVVPSCMAPPRPLDQAVAEIQWLKVRVEDVSQRNNRYNLIGDSGSGSSSNSSKHALVTTVSSPVAPEIMLPATSAADAAASSSAFHILHEVWEAAGKMRPDMGNLKRLITNEGSDLEVISLWRSPGSALDLGTTSILRKAYNDPEICQQFKIRAWVKLMHPFDLDEFLKSLLTQLEPHLRKTEEYNLIKAELMKQVSQQRYLVIVEELSTVVEWNAIRMYLPDSKNGSRIIVATQQLGLALSCTRDPYQVSELRKFSNGQSLCVFFNKKKGYLDQNKSRAFRSSTPEERVVRSRMVEAHDWTKKFELIGRSHIASDLRYKLSWNGVLSVWGVAGVGKSALVRSIYYDTMINDGSRFRKYSWVDVPQSFNLIDFSRRLLIDFHSVDLEAKETAAIDMMEGQDPIQWCCELLRQESCLVVIDGLRSTDDWDMIKAVFLTEPIKSCIFVITNEKSIATHCVDAKEDVINVKGLEAEAALDLFKKIAWGSEQLTSDEVQLSRLAMTKCGGLPKVITAIGEYCRPNIRWIKQVLENINANFMATLEAHPRFHSLRGLFSWMQSYFDDCPDSLKPCIFYLSVFPVGHDINIRRRRLLRRWIAEGYSRDTPDGTAEENGEKFFSELVKLSIIQQQESPSNADVCQVNGFFREYIISRPMQDNRVFALDGHCSLNSQHAGQHLTISSSWDRAKIVLESMDLSRLRSFTVFGEWRSFFISADVNMRLLRVLDLENTLGVTDGDLEQIGKLLPRLKFLSLRGCKDITCLPSSLGGLRQLQTLDIKGTIVVMLPPAIMKLEKLQYVRAGTTHSISSSTEGDNGTAVGVATPGVITRQPPGAATPPPPTAVDDDEARASTSWRSRLEFSWLSNLRRHKLISRAHEGVQFPASAAAGGIGKLRALHTLGVVNVSGAVGKAVLRELKKLDQLRKLKLLGINQKNWGDFCFTISGHVYLESLSVRLDDDEQPDHLCCLGDISKPPKTLKTLKLYGGNVHVSPVWMKQLDGLRKVELQDAELIVSTQEDIDSLVELRHRNMYRHFCVKPIQDGELRFRSMKKSWFGYTLYPSRVIKIDCGSYRFAIVFEEWIPAYVEVLEVHCSTTEASLDISGLGELWCLKEVKLKGSYSEAVKQHLQQKLAEHRCRPVLKLEDQQPAPTLPSAC